MRKKRIKFKMPFDRLIAIIAALGVPGLVFMTGKSGAIWFGGAAITSSLAALGPFGIPGGIAFLGVIGLISLGVTTFGYGRVFKAVMKNHKEKGAIKEDLIAKLEASRFISKALKRKIREDIEEMFDEDAKPKKKKHGDAEPEVKPERRKILKAVVGYTKKSAYVEFKPDDIIDYMKKNHIHVNPGTVKTSITSKRCFDPKSPNKKHIYYERVRLGVYKLHDINHRDIDPSWK